MTFSYSFSNCQFIDEVRNSTPDTSYTFECLIIRLNSILNPHQRTLHNGLYNSVVLYIREQIVIPQVMKKRNFLICDNAFKIVILELGNKTLNLANKIWAYQNVSPLATVEHFAVFKWKGNLIKHTLWLNLDQHEFSFFYCGKTYTYLCTVDQGIYWVMKNLNTYSHWKISEKFIRSTAELW